MAPIVLFVYNRPAHTLKTLEALAANDLADNSVLYIYADGAKENATAEDLNKIQETRNIIRQRQWCKEVNIIEQDKNKGLADSIIDGVTEIVNKHGKIIVLEDDLLLSPYFLNYMNDALTCYQYDVRVGQIGACNFFANGDKFPKQFFIPIPDCWGWGVWKNRWDKFNADAKTLLFLLNNDNRKLSTFNACESYDFKGMLQMQIDGKISSWAIRWQATCVLNNWLILYPNKSMTNHIQSHEATHTNINIMPPLEFEKPKLEAIEIKPLANVISAMKLGYSGKGNYFGQRISNENSGVTMLNIKEKLKILLSSFSRRFSQ